MDWAILEKVGIAGVAVAGFWVMYQVFIMFMKQWGASTEALNRNSDAYKELSKVFENAHERDLEFQKDMVGLSKDTNQKVSELHRELVERKGGNNHGA